MWKEVTVVNKYKTLINLNNVCALTRKTEHEGTDIEFLNGGNLVAEETPEQILALKSTPPWLMLAVAAIP